MDEKAELIQSPTPVPTDASILKKTNPLIWIISVILIAVLGVGIIIAFQLHGQGNKSPITQVPPTEPVASPRDKIISTPAAQLKKIAYIKDASIWVINSDGSNKHGVYFPEGQSNANPIGSQISSYYNGLAWKNPNELSFIFCSPVACQIKTTNIATQKSGMDIEKMTTDAAPGATAGWTDIVTLAWNHAGTQLAYIYKLPDGEERMDFKTGSVKNVVKNFATAPFGRGRSLDDDASIYFSPDDKYVLVTNTLNQPNNNDKSTIWVFKSNGKEIFNIESASSFLATQARWVAGYSVMYKLGNKIFYRGLTDSTSMEFGNAFNPNAYNRSPDCYGGTQTTLYWINSNRLPEVQYNSQNFVGYFKPECLDNTHIISLKAKEAPESKEKMSFFISSGLSLIDIYTNQITDLDSGDISLFTISP